MYDILSIVYFSFELSPLRCAEVCNVQCTKSNSLPSTVLSVSHCPNQFKSDCILPQYRLPACTAKTLGLSLLLYTWDVYFFKTLVNVSSVSPLEELSGCDILQVLTERSNELHSVELLLCTFIFNVICTL